MRLNDPKWKSDEKKKNMRTRRAGWSKRAEEQTQRARRKTKLQHVWNLTRNAHSCSTSIGARPRSAAARAASGTTNVSVGDAAAKEFVDDARDKAPTEPARDMRAAECDEESCRVATATGVGTRMPVSSSRAAGVGSTGSGGSSGSDVGADDADADADADEDEDD